MANVVQLDLLVAVAATGLLVTAILASDSKWHPISLYQWLNGKLSGKRRLPDYSKLTGFPAPKPIHHFDIDSAKPRPYRPFRWAYHQNMCELFCPCSTLCPQFT